MSIEMHRRGTDEEFKRSAHYLLHMLTEVCCFHSTRHFAIFYESRGCKNEAVQKTTFTKESCHNSVLTHEAGGPDTASANTAAAVANDQTHFLILQLLSANAASADSAAAATDPITAFILHLLFQILTDAAAL
jgi:hypothetical protein